MKESELMQYVRPSLLRGVHGATRTYDAMKLHFLKGIPQQDAAKQIGIHRTTLNEAVADTWKRMEKDGYSRTERRVFFYHKK